MKFSEATLGRVFVIRLEDGEVLHETIENFARQMGINAASLIALGGADRTSKLVVGPLKGRSPSIVPMELLLQEVHEITGVGTIFPNNRQEPILHMHIACGRKKATRTGCVRRGVKVWHVMEVILWELQGSSAKRITEPPTGFELLNP